MSNGKKFSIIGAVCMLIMVAIVGSTFVGYNNKEVDLRNSFVAQEKVSMSYFDKMWKIISQQAQITDKYKEDFKDIYIPLMEGRYKHGGGKMMMWVQEKNPEFDSSMYKKLMSTVEGQREGFHREQKKLVDFKRSHDNLRQKWPSSMVCGSSDPLELKLVTSSKTKKTFETGEENDVELFKK
jgi:hypothetical protein